MTGTKRTSQNRLGVAAGLEGRDALAHTLVLGDDVPQTACLDAVEIGAFRQVRRLGRAEPRRVATTDRRESALELGAPGRVPGVGETVSDARIEHDDREVGGQRHRAVLRRSAVEEERAPAAREDDRGRVHQSARHADGEAFRLAHEACQLEGIDAKSATSQSENATATRSAADDDRPAPIGSVESTSPTRPTAGRPRSARRRAIAAT